MTRTHALSVPAPLAPLAPLARRPPASPALPSLTRRAVPSVSSAVVLALLVLALLLQASFLVGLATGRGAGLDARPAASPVAVVC